MNTLLRYICALLWVGILCCFSYCEVLLFVISKNTETFENFFVRYNSETSMILTNVGLIAMLCVDNFITTLFTKSRHKTSVLDPCLIISILTAIFITIISQLILDGTFVAADWFKISYLFIVFVGSLIVYKAESLEISHSSNDSSILPPPVNVK